MTVHLENSPTGQKVPQLDSELEALKARVAQLESHIKPLKDEMAETKRDYRARLQENNNALADVSHHLHELQQL
jgi:cell division protein FtsB